MTSALQHIRDQVMHLPDADRLEALLSAVDRSGEDFADGMRNALESVRRADELEYGVVEPMARDETFSGARIAIGGAHNFTN